MQPMRAISQRVFVERAGLPCLLKSVALDEWQQGVFTLTGYLPRDLNWTSPQTLYLVFQESDDPKAFFDEQRPGRMITIDGVRIVKSPAVVLLKNRATGEVTMPVSEFGFTYEAIQQQNG